MKLIIDIPEKTIAHIRSDYGHGVKAIYNNDHDIICDAIYNGEKPKQGEWIKGKEISREMLGDKTLCIDYENFTCSNCGLILDRLLYHADGSPFYNFCPNCGASMKEGDEK